jgi:hypothetical protein
MVKKQVQFDERLRHLASKHRAMSHGYVTRMQPDGLIIAKPRRRQVRISGRSIFLFVAAFIGFKAFLVANLGPQAYDDRLARLQAGTVVEQAGAFAMQPDPLTMYFAKQIGPILR